MKGQKNPSEQKKKSRWMPMDKGGALSLMSQAKNAFLAGKPIDHPGMPPTILVSLPIHVANYLLEAFDSIQGGSDANSALGLKNGKGQPSRANRDAVIAIEIDLLRENGMLREEAKEIVAKKYGLSIDAAEMAYRKGGETSAFYIDVVLRKQRVTTKKAIHPKFSGEPEEDVAADFLNALRDKM